MNRTKTLLAAATLALGVVFGAPAQAAPTMITSLPTVLGTTFSVAFVFQDAGDDSTLSWRQGGSTNFLYDNKTSSVGTVFTGLGGAGPIEFILNNLSVALPTPGSVVIAGVNYVPVVPNFFAGSSNVITDFTGASLNAAALAAVSAIGAGGIFIGFEDRASGDNDYNDLIYYFKGVSVAVPVPTPAALALFSFGLIGLGLARRRV